MAAFRAQAPRLLQRMQGLCINTEASSGGILQPISLLQPSRPHSTAVAASAAAQGVDTLLLVYHLRSNTLSSSLAGRTSMSASCGHVAGSTWLLQGQTADCASPQHSRISSLGSLWQWGCQREAAAAVPPAGDMLWAPHGLHSLQPAIAAALASLVSSEGEWGWL